MNEMLNQVVTFLQENVLMANVLSGTTVVGFVGTAISLIKSQKKIIKTTTDDTKTLNEVVALKNEVSSLKASQAQTLALLQKANETQVAQTAIFSEAFLGSNLPDTFKSQIASQLATLKSSIPTNIPNVDLTSIAQNIGIPNLSAESLQNLTQAQIEALKAKLEAATSPLQNIDINSIISKATSAIEENKNTAVNTAMSIIDKLRNGDTNV